MAKRLIWTDENLNCHGFWVLTSGIDTSRFDRNPIMLFNHHRSWEGKRDEILPTGRWENYRAEADGVMTGEPVFDMKDDFAAKIGRKVEDGFLSACSIGIRIIEVSEDPKYLKPGQLRATVTKCELREVSIVDIPANPNAAGVVLYDADDKVITLSEGGEGHPLQLINHKKDNQMNHVALKLGLAEGASEAQVLAAVTSLQEKHAGEIATLKSERDAAQAEVKRLKDEKEAAEKAEAVALVDAAVKEGKIAADLKETYLGLCAVDFAKTKTALAGMAARQNLRERVATGGGEQYASMSWDDLDRKGLLAELKEKHPDLYDQKFKSMCEGLNIKN